jgi:hypothetical protein
MTKLRRTTPSEQTVAEVLVTGYCDAWNESDPARRRKILEPIWAQGATYTDPTVDLTGIDELVGHIDRVFGKYPGSRIVRTSVVDVHHSVLRFTWHKELADGRALAESIDIGEISGDGKLGRIVGFFGPIAAIPTTA